MNFSDMIIMGFANLWRSKLRTLLTTLGVVVGIGALTSMVSFGTGMQKNMTDSFTDNDLFTSMRISPANSALARLQHGDLDLEEENKKDENPLTDSVFQLIKKMDFIEITYPEVSFAVNIRFQGEETKNNAAIMPAAMQRYSPYNELLAGSFYESDSVNKIVVSQSLLKKLKIILRTENKTELNKKDSSEGFRLVEPESLIGEKIELVTAIIDPTAMMGGMLGRQQTQKMPLKDFTTTLEIGGIMEQQMFAGNLFAQNLLIPMHTGQKIPKVDFTNVFDFFGDSESDYSSIYVRVGDPSELTAVRKQIEEMGFSVFALADQLEEFKSVFLILSSILAVIGTIALLVAALGIINTMVMSILERTREIGVMKSIGGSENEIRSIFFVEAAAIGLLGGIFGLILGWLVTRVANFVMRMNTPMGTTDIDLFYFPLWLILGATVFSIVISLGAGLYPAIRAARIDPVKALRHD